MIYAAYGSNLNHGQMAIRCPKAKFLGTGILFDYRLVFKIHADVVPSPGSRVPIGLWKITTECLKSLDQYEGYPWVYDRQTIEVVKPNRRKVKALCYFHQSERFGPPTEAYLQSIFDGYADCGIPEDRLLEAMEIA